MIYSTAGIKQQNQDFHGVYLPEGHVLKQKGIACVIADGIGSSNVSHLAAETAVGSFLSDYYSTSDAWSTQTSAERVIRAPELAALFTPDALAEVAITASYDNQPLSGAIDRLIVREDRVLAVDYKSNALVPSRPEDVPEGLRRQMAAYRAALQQIYPGRKVETAILWTKTATLMPVG